MKFSDDAKAIMAAIISTSPANEWGFVPPKQTWERVDALLAAAPKGEEAYPEGIHPPKNPMPGGFSLENFMPGLDHMTQAEKDAMADSLEQFCETLRPSEPAPGAPLHPAVVARMKGLEKAISYAIHQHNGGGHPMSCHWATVLQNAINNNPLPPGWDKPRVEPTDAEWWEAWKRTPGTGHGQFCKAVAAEAQRLADQRAEREGL